VLAAARRDPLGFIAELKGPVILDEVQHAPDIFPAIKISLDRDRRPGRFLLTGSANILFVPRVSESLAGRMEILTLWPLSQGEIEGIEENLIDRCFSDRFMLPQIAPKSAADRDKILSRVVRGGYPEVLERKTEERRRSWFGAYITTILQRDVREMANIEGLTKLPLAQARDRNR
jgi:predicted AAA+ superfamily ATPase